MGEVVAPPNDPLLTVREVATIMRVSNMTVYRLIRDGSLPATRVGKNFRIRNADVGNYLDSHVVTGRGSWPSG